MTMYEITDSDGTVHATVSLDPVEVSVTQAADDDLRDIILEGAAQKQMNRTSFDGEPAFDPPLTPGPDDPPDSVQTPIDMEVPQDPSEDYQLDTIHRFVSRRGLFMREQDRAQAQGELTEGQKVRVDGQRAIIVEVRTETFEGPDGEEHDASEDSPAYIVGTQDGAMVASAADISAESWDTGRDSPDKELADAVAGDDTAEGRLEAGVTDWDFPDSWKESDIPARLILLDAWAGMNGQFDCPSGDCCKGTMLRSGMSERAANQFCASMKDRVLLWEGWRKGG